MINLSFKWRENKITIFWSKFFSTQGQLSFWEFEAWGQGERDERDFSGLIKLQFLSPVNFWTRHFLMKMMPSCWKAPSSPYPLHYRANVAVKFCRLKIRRLFNSPNRIRPNINRTSLTCYKVTFEPTGSLTERIWMKREMSQAKGFLNKVLSALGGGLHSTEETFAFLTQQSRVWIPALLLSSWAVEIGKKIESI